MLKAIDESIELAKRFENVLVSIKNQLPFQESWRSTVGPGYDGAVNLDLRPGEVAKSVDNKTGTRMIFIGTDLDTVVVYERSTGISFALLYNANAALNFLLGGSYLSIAQFSTAITDYNVDLNIGASLADLNNRIGRRKAKAPQEPKPLPK